MRSKVERQAEKIIKARERVSRVLVDDLDADPDLAEVVAESCVSSVFSGRAPRRPLFPRLAATAKRAVRPALWAALCLALLWGGKWVFYDHSHWFSVYPRTYVRVEGWRPKARPYASSSWDELRNKDDGTCMIAAEKACLSNYLVPKVSEALDRAVRDDVQGVVWEGGNGNGELWAIERKDFRFVITARDDPAMQDE